MRYPLVLTCNVRDQQALQDPYEVGLFLERLVESGYRLVAEEKMSESFAAWWHIRRGQYYKGLTAAEEAWKPTIQEAGMTETLRIVLSSYLARDCAQIKLRAYHTEQTLEFDIEFSPYSDGWYSIAVDRDYLGGNYEDNNLVAYERWLEVVKLAYRHLHPFYGSIFDTDFVTLSSDADWLEALMGHVNHLTLVNIFGPALVQRFRRERLLSTPAWRCEELDDRGIMLLPEPYWYEYAPNWRLAADHLGVSTAHYRYIAHIVSVP